MDATVLARLYASSFLPEVWIPDAATLSLRRQVARRNQIVRQRVRLKTIAQSILHTHLLPQCPHADLFGNRGRIWLTTQRLPLDERDAVERHLREYDRLGEDLRVVERELAQAARASDDIKRLMTIPGVDMVLALGLAAAIGPIVRYKGPEQLVAYLGLNPSVYQSGDGPPQHGRITKQGGTTREACWSKQPGRLCEALDHCVGSMNALHVAAATTSRL
jgi:transposase